ncbi:hypothetical protein ABN154_29715, partial [Klebsiella michiganensis]
TACHIFALRNYQLRHLTIPSGIGSKFYASVSDQTSASVKSTITPLFEYKINDKCNSISQKLIKEFESRARKSELKDGLAR